MRRMQMRNREEKCHTKLLSVTNLSWVRAGHNQNCPSLSLIMRLSIVFPIQCLCPSPEAVGIYSKPHSFCPIRKSQRGPSCLMQGLAWPKMFSQMFLLWRLKQQRAKTTEQLVTPASDPGVHQDAGREAGMKDTERILQQVHLGTWGPTFIFIL